MSPSATFVSPQAADGNLMQAVGFLTEVSDRESEGAPSASDCEGRERQATGEPLLFFIDFSHPAEGCVQTVETYTTHSVPLGQSLYK